MRSSIKATALLLGIGLSVTGHAQTEQPFDTGWYFGGGVGVNDVYSYDEICPWCYGSSTYGDSDVGYSLSGGLRINSYLAIEASYYGNSKMGWDEGVVFDETTLQAFALDADIELSSWQVNVLGILAGRKWEGYVRLGLSMWNAQSDQLLTAFGTGEQFTQRLDQDGDNITVGFGVGRSFGDDWQWRVDYGVFAIDDEILGVGGSESAYTDALSAQILKRFRR